MPDLTLSLATLKGQSEGLKQAKEALDTCAAAVARLQVTTSQQVQATVEALNGLDSVGYYSSIDQVLRQERFAGKSASVDFIKANPTCTEQQALDAWQAAGLAATGLPALLQNHVLLAKLYQQNLLAGGYTSEATWEAQRAWIIATPKSVIMGA